jgi:DNA-binding NtrC family response regulator
MSRPILTVLCIDHDEDLLAFLAQLLSQCGYSILTASGLENGLRMLAVNAVDAVVLATDLPKLDLETAIPKIHSCRAQADVVLYGGPHDIPDSVLELALGRVSRTDVSSLSFVLASVAREQHETS